MKKLTKTLSLVLVVAMVLSLCVIGAGASYSSFTDKGKITTDYSEAVEVMTDLGCVSGMSATSFAPAGTLTRAQAAVILTRLTLGANADNYVPSKVTFKDVPISFWGYKFVEYAVQSGYVAGTGNGKYDPNATLTGYQWAAMLMKVLNISVPTTGTDWQINTAKAYYGDDAFSSVVISAASITREAATQMAYDALFKANSTSYGYPVYDKDANLIGVYDSIADAALAATTLNNGQSIGYTYKTTKESMGTSTLAYNVFGVTKNAKGIDSYGRPSNTYTTKTAAQATAYGWNAAKYGSAAKVLAKAAVTVYKEGLTTKSYTALVTANPKYFTASPTVYVNGEKQTSLTVAQIAARNYYGTLVEFYDTNSTDAYAVDTVVVVDGWFTAVSNVVSTYKDTTKNYIELTVYNPYIPTTGKAVVKFYDDALTTASVYDKLTASLKKGDVCETYWTGAAVAEANFIEVAPLTAVTGSITATKLDSGNNGTITVDNKTYTMSTGYGSGKLTASTAAYNIYFDANGYVLGAKAVTDTATTAYYGVVLDYAYANGVAASNMTGAAAKDPYEKVQVYTSTGAVAIYDTAFTYSTSTLAITKRVAPAAWDPSAVNSFDGKLIAYTLNAAGKINAIVAADAAGTLETQSTKGAAFKTNGTDYATASTAVFIMKSGETNYTAANASTELAVYTGYANVPAATYTAGEAFGTTTDYAAGAVSAKIASVPASTTTSQFAMLTSAVPTITQNASDSSMYNWTYDAIIDGKEGTLTWIQSNAATAPTADGGAALATGALYTVTFDTTTKAVATLTAQTTSTANAITVTQPSFYVTGNAAKYVNSSTVYYEVTMNSTNTTATGFTAATALPTAPTSTDTFVIHEFYSTCSGSAPTGVTYVFYYVVY
ncbi:MAG: S-layer homology domain-containing protein [Oscillospiraceae bacterium]|nr:S-layer homology domain-containing protein [Oscillospiraceae bacterium]